VRASKASAVAARSIASPSSASASAQHVAAASCAGVSDAIDAEISAQIVAMDRRLARQRQLLRQDAHDRAPFEIRRALHRTS